MAEEEEPWYTIDHGRVGEYKPLNLLSIGASLLGGILTRKGARQRNVAQIASARRQMEFQERMSSSAVQRQVADMRLAGINPVMASRYGGSSTPMGAQASVEDELGPSVASAKEAARVMEELKLMKANSRKALDQSDQARQTAIREKATTDLTEQTTVVKKLEEDLRKIELNVAGYNEKTSARFNELRQAEIGLAKKFMREHPDIAMYHHGLSGSSASTTAAGQVSGAAASVGRSVLGYANRLGHSTGRLLFRLIRGK